MKKLTLLIALICCVSTFSVNIVSNGTFEHATYNYGWTSVGSQTVAAETTAPLSGLKSYKATLTAGSGLANTIYSWTPIALAKAATYKITFKAKATNAANLTVLITNVTALTGNSITNQTVSLTSTVQSFELTFTNTNICGYNIFHFLYGNFPSGTVITLDDVSIQEITSPLTNGNLCLGDFETTMVTGTTKTPNPTGYSSYGASGTGWTYLKPSGGTFLEGISATNPISGTKSANLSISGTGAPGATNISHMYVWSFNAALGKKFTCTFKAKVSTGTFNAGIKFASYDLVTTNFENLTGVPLTTTAQTFTFTSNAISVYSAYYVLCLEIGTLPIGSVITLDDVELYQSEVETPTVVDASSISSSGFTASWNAIPRAVSYDVNIYQGASLVSGSPFNANGQATTSKAITGLSPNTAYTYTVTAKGNGTNTFDSPASTASASFTTNMGSQTITFGSLTAKTYGDAPYTISATGGASGNPVVFTSSDATVASCSGTNGTTITINNVGSGSCTIYANQASNSNYNAASQVSQTLTVNPKTLTITATGANKTYGSTQTTPVTGSSAYTITSGSLAGSETIGSVTLTYGTGALAATDAAGNTSTITPSAATGGTFNAGNYAITYATGTLSVIQKALTIPDAVATSKVYDGTNAAVVSGTLNGIVNSDAVTCTTGTFASVNVANNIPVTCILSDAKAGNYTLTQPGISANITAASAPSTGGNITDSGLTDSQLANTDITVTSGELIIDAGKTVHSITVNGGARLSVATNQTLALSNLTLKSDATNGTSTFINEGTLTVSGTTNVEQYLATTRNWYVSSPVTNANAPAGYTYYSRYEPGGTATGWTPVSVGSGLTAGVGYIALPGTAGIPITFTTQSGGTLNNGTIPVSLTYTPAATSGSGYNLIGNPYPSHLTWNKAFTDANVAKIEPTIWYRTNSGSSNTGGWSFKTYNAYTGVGSPDGTTGIIPPMQAFWVLAKQTTSIDFTNTMRSHQTGNPLKAPGAKTSENKLLRLQVSNGSTTDETVILFNPNAANIYDDYDSPKMMNNAADIADIYTMADSKKLVINGMSSVKYDTEIPLGFSTLTANDFSISANEMTNFEAGTRIILIDKQNLNVENELTKGKAYNFSAGITPASTNRFSLIFRAPGVATGIDNATKLNVQVFVNTANQITIIAPEKATYSIYNTIGQKQYESMLTSTKTTIDKVFGAGVYVVSITVNGQSEIQKVIIR